LQEPRCVFCLMRSVFTSELLKQEQVYSMAYSMQAVRRSSIRVHRLHKWFDKEVLVGKPVVNDHQISWENSWHILRQIANELEKYDFHLDH